MVPPLLRVRGGLPLILWFLDVVVDVVLDLVLLCCDVLLVLEAARQLVQPLENPWLRHQFLLQLIRSLSSFIPLILDVYLVFFLNYVII